ncbi:MAG: type II toxin-antitoxin system prevent-host-death family antitoxin [Myxococcales bacterium]|nr:MAG: type II toxin-antitoxin system prevent-host-death family antitoxin [Myxococcales bacterium]
MDIGVRELKQKLSEYLEKAAKGEVIRVTDRGVPKAILGPLPGRDRLDEGIAEGWVTASEDAPIAKVEPATSSRQIADVLAEDRGE